MNNNNNNNNNKRDALSPLLFIIVILPLNHIIRTFTAGYTLSKSHDKINHLTYMDDMELFSKNEKELETNKCSENIQSGYRDGIWHRKMCHASNEK